MPETLAIVASPEGCAQLKPILKRMLASVSELVEVALYTPDDLPPKGTFANDKVAALLVEPACFTEHREAVQKIAAAHDVRANKFSDVLTVVKTVRHRWLIPNLEMHLQSVDPYERFEIATAQNFKARHIQQMTSYCTKTANKLMRSGNFRCWQVSKNSNYYADPAGFFAYMERIGQGERCRQFQATTAHLTSRQPPDDVPNNEVYCEDTFVLGNVVATRAVTHVVIYPDAEEAFAKSHYWAFTQLQRPPRPDEDVGLSEYLRRGCIAQGYPIPKFLHTSVQDC